LLVGGGGTWIVMALRQGEISQFASGLVIAGFYATFKKLDARNKATGVLRLGD
jgi:hypothetical protein